MAINEETQALAFVARFTPIGLIPQDEAEWSPEWVQSVVYVFRLLPGSILHREFRPDEMKERFGTASLGDILKPAILEKLFTSPKL